MIRFTTYGPDLDPTTPGVMTNCAALVPSSKGFKGAPAPASTTLPALGAACRGAAYVRKLDDTTRFFAGTANNLYEAADTSWTDRTGTVSGLGSNNQWRFAQFGDVSLAAAKTEILQALTTASAFANATSTAPKGAIVETANNFVFLFDVNDQGAIYDSADRSDGWWCAAKGGHTSWVPSVTTEAATGELRSTPGGITGARRFGYQIIAYKQRSMYLGTYVGAGAIWDWQLLPGEAGALSHEGVVNVGTPENPRHLFIGVDDFYSFSGGRAVPIGEPVRVTVFGELNAQFFYACKAMHDAKNGLVYFYYPVGSANTPDKCVVYDYRRNKWGRDNRTIEQAVEYIAGGVTYDALGASYATYDDLPAQPYDIAFNTQGASVPAIFNTSHVLQQLNGAASSVQITTGDYGDPLKYSTVTRVIPVFLSNPASANLVSFYRDNLGDALTQGETVALSKGRFDFLRSARWHRARLDITGDNEIIGFDPHAVEDGEQ